MGSGFQVIVCLIRVIQVTLLRTILPQDAAHGYRATTTDAGSFIEASRCPSSALHSRRVDSGTDPESAAPFSQIEVSEQRHFDAVGVLLTRYRLQDPSAGREAGSYAFPELQREYDDWLVEGSVSLEAAYQVGIELETRDITDLEDTLERSENADVDRVLGHLLRGSQHHLNAYTRAAEGDLPPEAGQGPGRQMRGQRMGPGDGQGPDQEMRGQRMGPGGGPGMRGQGGQRGGCRYDPTG